MLLYYREEKDGQILEEGITEAGSMASFTAAGTAYANYRVPMIPFFIYYSMFGFQRIGDMIWAFADSRGKGFLMGGTAGRTTLLGEGLQHQDGHSHRALEHRSHLPQLRSGVRVRDRRHRAGRHPPHVSGRRRPSSTTSRCTTKTTRCRRCRTACSEGILRGIYKFKPAPKGKADGAAVRQRPDPERGAARAGDSGREVRRRRPTSGA